MTSRRRLTEWLGDDATNSEALISTLHELLTGAYELETFKSDVAAYDIDEDDSEPEPEDWTTTELFTYLQERGLISSDAQLKNWMDDSTRTDMIKMVKDDIETIEDSHDGKFDVLSPDGISIHHEDVYDSPEAAKAALTEWVKRYEAQGYYSSGRNGRIPYDEIESYCEIVPVG